MLKVRLQSRSYWYNEKNSQAESLLVNLRCTLCLNWNAPYLVGSHPMFTVLGGRTRGLKIYYGHNVNSAVELSCNFFNIYFSSIIIIWVFISSPHLLTFIYSVDRKGILLGSDWLHICCFCAVARKWSLQVYVHVFLAPGAC